MARIDRGRAHRRTANEPHGLELQVVIAQFPEISGPLSNRKHRSRWTEPFLVVQRLLATYLACISAAIEVSGRGLATQPAGLAHEGQSLSQAADCETGVNGGRR
jgi:hypothetical protein